MSSLVVPIKIIPPVSIPVAPLLSATQISGTLAQLSWTPTATATGYTAYMYEAGTWRSIATPGSSARSFVCTGSNAPYNTGEWFQVDAGETTSTTVTTDGHTIVVSSGQLWDSNMLSFTMLQPISTDHPGSLNDPYGTNLAGVTYSQVNGILWTTGTNGSPSPKPTDVQQGDLGDCWLLASLCDTAAPGSQDIPKMFTPDGNYWENGVITQVYTVHLYSTTGIVENIIVHTMLPDGGTLYDHPVNGALWVALVEKAYVIAGAERYVTTDVGQSSQLRWNCPSTASNTYQSLDYAPVGQGTLLKPVDDGGYATWAEHAISGHTPITVAPSNISALDSYLNAGYIVVGGTGGAIDSNPGIVSCHYYAVLAYASGITMLPNPDPYTLLNPWGMAPYTGQNVGKYHEFPCNSTATHNDTQH
jgi:Calpain family cysteine protease